MTTSAISPALFETAVNSLHGAVMLTDASGKIVYLNNAAEEFFKTREATLRTVNAEFCTSWIVGKTWDGLLAELQASGKHSVGTSDVHGRQFSIADFDFRITATSMYSDPGQYSGQVIEWEDYSEAAAIEQEVQDVLAGIASGDLTHRVEGNCEGFFGHLKTSINLTVDKLIDVVQRIKQASDSVAGGSIEICQGNKNLSQHTEEQASSLEETSSSMEQMTSTVQQNAENARQADQLAQGAKDRAERGGEVVGKAIEAMSEINSASKRIADIIGVIDEIAFQTNLLALNASVEAARAGDQGRGFAVVASEVRNLAGRSATAAKEIKELIQDSVAKVEQGSRLVDESGKTLEGIISEVQRVTDIVGDISGASLEQAAGIEEVNKAIAMMDEMTQQNAALVEQAAAASEAMGDQAAELKTEMNFFKLNHSDGVIDSATLSSARPAPELVVTANKPQLKLPDIPPAESMPFPVYDKDDGGEWEEF